MKYKALATNILTLTSLHAINFGLTLITVSLVTHRFGVEGWGNIVFAQIIFNYLIWLSNWSYYLSATKEIAINKINLSEIEEIFNVTWMAQALLTIIGVILLLCGINYIPQLHTHSSLYLIGIGLLVGNLVQPLWFLNGMGMIRVSATLQITNKLISLIAIYIFTNNSSEPYLYFVATSLGIIVTGSSSLYWIKRKYKIKFQLTSFSSVLTSLRGSYSLFLSTIWSNFYSSVVPMALGLLSEPTVLGYYNLAERVRGAAIQVVHPITHVMFPEMCESFSTDPLQAKRMLKYSGIGIMIMISMVSICIYIYADILMQLIAGKDFISSTGILKILIYSLPVIAASEFLIYQWLIPIGKNKLINTAKIVPLGLVLATSYPIITSFGASGAAWLNVTAEGVIVLIIIYGLCKKKIGS